MPVTIADTSIRQEMTPSHLYALAEWIDLKYPNDSDPEVQTDLRRLADALAKKEADDEH